MFCFKNEVERAMIVSSTPWQSDTVAHHYDELDPFYRRLWGEHLHHGLWVTGTETPTVATLQLLTRVAQRAQLRPGAIICDVGSGYGAPARWLAAQYGAYVTALTLSPAQYAYAQRQTVAPHVPPPTYMLHNWLTNPLPAQTFDGVLAIESTEHMADIHTCFAEARRVLRPGGRFVVCAWLAREAPRPWEVRALLEPICREGRLARLGSMTEYRAWLQQAGFVVERCEDVSAQVQRTWTVVLRRLLHGFGTQQDYWQYLLDRQCRERVFGWTIGRIWLAYRTGALRYGILSAYRP
jgi:tocopherol O-methyltransferase